METLVALALAIAMVTIMTLPVIGAPAADVSGAFEALVAIVTGATGVIHSGPETFDDTAGHRLPPGSDPLPVPKVGLHVGWKLFFDWFLKENASGWSITVCTSSLDLQVGHFIASVAVDFEDLRERYDDSILGYCDAPVKRNVIHNCLVVVVQVELDLVLSSKQSAFQCAIRQAVREEQLIKNHMVLEHIRVQDGGVSPAKMLPYSLICWQQKCK